MSSLKSYMDNKILKYSVTIGRKTFKGYLTPIKALKAGVEKSQYEDTRANELIFPQFKLNTHIRLED